MLTIGILLFPDFQLLDAAGPVSAFDIAGRYAGGAYAIHLIAAEPGPVRSGAGIALTAEGLESAAEIDTLLVVGGEGTQAAMADPRLLDFIRGAAQRARRVASVCSGTYLLAAAGLLDGLRATTHWCRSADFARRFPQVRLEPDRIYVREGAIWSSAGITAGIDLALAMIAEDCGETVSRQTAQQLVVYHRRPGGQSQFSALLDLDGAEERFSTLLGWAREHLHERLTVDRLADQAGMSPRNFARQFAGALGVTPARAIERLRVETARARIESTSDPVDRIATTTGFGDPERMRRAFLRAFGQPPQALRRGARV